MEFRYMGFEQTTNRRFYKFDAATLNGPAERFVVSVDLDLFPRNRVNIQEGPSLCALKVKVDLETQHEGEHQLTNEDLAAHIARRDAEAAQKAESRKAGQRRHKAVPGQPVSPWWR